MVVTCFTWGHDTGNDRGDRSFFMAGAATSPLTRNTPFVLKLRNFFVRPTASSSRAARRFNASVLLAGGRSNWMRYAAVRLRPAPQPIPRLRPREPVQRVHVLRDAAPAGVFLAHCAAPGAAPARPHHDEHCVGSRCCANDQQQQLRGREGRTEPQGVLAHAPLRRSVPLDGWLAHALPCLPRGARLPNPDSHFF